MLITLLILSVLFIVGLLNMFYSKKEKKKKNNNNSEVTSSSIQKAQKLEELKRVFSTFDKNKDGLITKEELRESMKNLKIMISEKEVEEMVEKLDGNRNGFIEFDEFCNLFDSNHPHEDDDDDDDDELMEAFQVFDKDKDGLISEEELGFVLLSLGLKEGRKIQDCKKMIKKVDLDGDGMVDFMEFKKMMRNGANLISAF